MVVLGIDPGLHQTGVGVIQWEASEFRFLDAQTITTASNDPLPLRLAQIYDQLHLIILKYRPQTAGVEKLYFQKNITSALPVAHARGIILFALVQENVEIGEYDPTQIKKSVVGLGSGNKQQIQHMVQLLLRLSAPPSSSHTADALAVAITHSHHLHLL